MVRRENYDGPERRSDLPSNGDWQQHKLLVTETFKRQEAWMMSLSREVSEIKIEHVRETAELRGMLANIESKIDSSSVGKLSGRVDKLEQWRSLLLGMGLLITVVLIPIVIAYFESRK